MIISKYSEICCVPLIYLYFGEMGSNDCMEEISSIHGENKNQSVIRWMKFRIFSDDIRFKLMNDARN